MLAASLPTFVFFLPHSMTTDPYRNSRSPMETDGRNSNSQRDWGSESDMVGIVRKTEIDIDVEMGTIIKIPSKWESQDHITSQI
jgi:hypothetical protein